MAGFTAPLLIPLVIGSDLPSGWKTFLSGFLALGIPEILMIIAAGILGKKGFAYLKAKLWRFIEPAETVSLLRYRLGLLMFFVPVLFIWLHPYLEQAQPHIADKRVMMGMISVVLVSVSLFLLGGEFWNKLRGLFIYDMSVVQPSKLSNTKPVSAQSGALPPKSRLFIGGLFFSFSLILPVFIPLLSYVSLNEEVRLVIGGLMVFGIPQVLMLLTVTILGKPGFDYLKQRLGGLLSRLLAAQVSQARYRLGLILLLIPLIVGITWPYLTFVFNVLHLYTYEIAIAGDVILILAVFILGGEFWEKLMSLFRYHSRVAVLPIT